MAKKIHDLASVANVVDAMQLETDTSGTVSNKITALQMKAYAQTGIPVIYTPTNYAPSAATLEAHLAAIDTKLGELQAIVDETLLLA